MGNETRQLQVGEVVYFSGRWGGGKTNKTTIDKVTPKQAKSKDGSLVWLKDSRGIYEDKTIGFPHYFIGLGDTGTCYLETPELKANYEDHHYREFVIPKINNKSLWSLTTDQLKQIAQILNIE